MKAPEMRKAAAGRQAAFLETSNDTVNHTRPGNIKQSAKRLIVGAACWGIMPIKLADWLIKRGGLRHE